MDSTFTKQKLAEVDLLTVNFVLQLYKDGLRHKLRVEDEQIEVGEQPKKKKKSSRVEDPFLMSLLSVAEKVDHEVSNGEDKFKTELRNLKETITSELMEFKRVCERMDMATVLAQVGTKKYHKIKDKQDLKIELENKLPKSFKDLFNVLHWWTQIGSNTFPHLHIAATLILGKPQHNGFQERVFSTGTYKDSRLAKRKHADNFEMSVLEHVNQAKIISNRKYQELLEQESRSTLAMSQRRRFIDAFFEKARTAEIIVEDCEPVQEKTDSDTEDEECISVCCDDLGNQESGRQTKHRDECTVASNEPLKELEEDDEYHFPLAIPTDMEPGFNWADFDDGFSDIESEEVIDLSSPTKQK